MPADSVRRTSNKKLISAVDKINKQQITVKVGGKSVKVGPKLALQLKTFEDASNFSIPAIRKVLKWMRERDAARKRTERIGLPVVIRFENQNPVSMDDALLLLDIATEQKQLAPSDGRYLRLRSWAVQHAVDRPCKRLDAREFADLLEHIDGAGSIQWPKGFGDV